MKYPLYLHLFQTSWATRPWLCPLARPPAHVLTRLPPALTFINKRDLTVKILTKITAIVSQSCLDINFYIVRITSV
jgi:hypothetical protein